MASGSSNVQLKEYLQGKGERGGGSGLCIWSRTSAECSQTEFQAWQRGNVRNPPHSASRNVEGLAMIKSADQVWLAWEAALTCSRGARTQCLCARVRGRGLQRTGPYLQEGFFQPDHWWQDREFDLWPRWAWRCHLLLSPCLPKCLQSASWSRVKRQAAPLAKGHGRSLALLTLDSCCRFHNHTATWVSVCFLLFYRVIGSRAAAAITHSWCSLTLSGLNCVFGWLFIQVESTQAILHS